MTNLQFYKNFDEKNSDEPWSKFDHNWSKIGSKFTSASRLLGNRLMTNTCYQKTFQQPLQHQYQHYTPTNNYQGLANQTNAITIVVGKKLRVPKTHCVYNPLGELLDAIFEKFIHDNLIEYPQTQSVDLNTPKESWYRENKFCKFHRVKGHTTLRCMQLKDYVQDLIDHKEITKGAQASPNVGLLIYQNAFPLHNNKNASKTPIQHNNTNNNRMDNA